jgi:hypothetical protein
VADSTDWRQTQPALPPQDSENGDYGSSHDDSEDKILHPIRIGPLAVLFQM